MLKQSTQSAIRQQKLVSIVELKSHAADAIGFFQKAFAAELIQKIDTPTGTVMHAEMRLGQALFMLSEQSDDWGTQSPPMLQGTSVGVMIYIRDVDALEARAAKLFS